MRNLYISLVIGMIVLGSFGYAGLWNDLSAIDPANWVNTSAVLGVSHDHINNKVYTGMAGGKFGVYNATDIIWYDLSDTDAGDWVSTNNINTITYDHINNKVYTGMAGGKFGVYNITDNIWYDLSATDPANWVSTNNLHYLYYDHINNKVYTSLTQGNLGVYNATDNIWYDLSATDTGDWVSTSDVWKMDYDYTNNLLYTAIIAGKFGVYNATSNVWSDLSATDPANWVSTSPVVSVSYDYTNNKVYTGIGSGKLGVYNATDNIWYDLSATDTGNWVGTTNVYGGLVFDHINDKVYTGLSGGKFGVYNITDNIWYDLSATDPANWVEISNINDIDYDYINDLVYTGLSGGRFGVFDPLGVSINTSNFYINNYNEKTGAELNIYNITLTNSTNTQSYLNQNNTFICDIDCYFRGQTRITISKDGYVNREYYYLGDGRSFVLSSYLLENADSQYTSFSVVTFLGSPIENALIQASRVIGGSSVVVAEGRTDGAGNAFLWLDPTYTYEIYVSATGFITTTTNIRPSSANTIITLFSNYEVDFTSSWIDIDFAILPYIEALDGRVENQQFHLITNATGSNILTSYGFNLTLENGTVLCSETGSNPVGSVLSCNVNLTLYEGTLNFDMFLNVDGYNTTYTHTKVYRIYQYLSDSNSNLWYVLTQFDTYGFSGEFRLIIMFILVLVVGGFGSIGMNLEGGVWGILILIGIFAYIGWIGIFYAIVFILVCIGLIVKLRMI